jgi:hypothetical protein
MKLTSVELLRLARNLETAPLTDVLTAAVGGLEALREFVAGVMADRPLDVELLDKSIKPIVRELVKWRLQLETMPATRGNA